MKLTIDIGNTRTKLALFEHKKIFSSLKVTNCSLKKIKKFAANYCISSTIISSVIKNSNEISRISNYYNALVLCKNTDIPIFNHYKSPDSLGNDRLAAVIGANSLYPKKDIIVIDSGTCLTIDFINKKGEFFGGRISPGIEMRYKAVHNFTEKLPLVERKKNIPEIGNDTYSSILSGVEYGILAEVRSAISEFRSENPGAIALLTGGDCFFFEKELKNSIFANPNLVLIGLNEILDFNE